MKEEMSKINEKSAKLADKNTYMDMMHEQAQQHAEIIAGTNKINQ